MAHINVRILNSGAKAQSRWIPEAIMFMWSFGFGPLWGAASGLLGF